MARSYSDELKAEVMSRLLEGQSVRAVADEYDIPRGTVGNWSVKLSKSGVPDVADKSRQEIGDRLVELMHQMITTQLALLKKMEGRQPARDFHGIRNHQR